MKLTELIYAFLIGSSIQSTVISGTYISKKFLGKLYKQNFTTQSVLLPILALVSIISIIGIAVFVITRWRAKIRDKELQETFDDLERSFEQDKI